MEDLLPGGSSSGAALRPLFDRYHDRVRAFFRSRGFVEEETEDLTQETFLRVFQSVDKLRSPGSLDTWILRLAANIWKNEVRFRRAAKRGAIVLSLDRELNEGDDRSKRVLLPRAGEPNGLEEALSAEQQGALRACVEELPRKMRRCLEMHFFQERPTEEIGTLLHISAQTVKSHIHQAKHHLRDCVARRLGGLSR